MRSMSIAVLDNADGVSIGEDRNGPISVRALRCDILMSNGLMNIKEEEFLKVSAG